MAKNKNRKQSGPPNRAPRDERAREQAQHVPAEEQEPAGAHIPGSPTEVARKRQKRFGHN